MIAAKLAGVQVWVATTPVDMRKSFDGLAEVVRSFLKADPLSGNLFVFRNRGGQRVKVLWWDTEGLVIYYKRLEQGEFRWPRSGEVALEITAPQLLRLLSGLEIAERRGESRSDGHPPPLLRPPQRNVRPTATITLWPAPRTAAAG